MPVVGHAFVGMAVAISTRPPEPDRSAGASAGGALWLAVAVGLSYLPDVVTQLLLLVGWRDGGLLGHSVLFAVTTSAVVAATLRRLTRVSIGRAFATSLLAILLHDLFDLLEATD